MKITAAITGVSHYVPDYILTNEILETMMDTSNEWIMARSGIYFIQLIDKKGAVLKTEKFIKN